jgi:hypothetical protein
MKLELAGKTISLNGVMLSIESNGYKNVKLSRKGAQDLQINRRETIPLPQREFVCPGQPPFGTPKTPRTTSSTPSYINELLTNPAMSDSPRANQLVGSYFQSLSQNVHKAAFLPICCCAYEVLCHTECVTAIGSKFSKAMWLSWLANVVARCVRGTPQCETPCLLIWRRSSRISLFKLSLIFCM